jgi:hypothetical protein
VDRSPGGEPAEDLPDHPGWAGLDRPAVVVKDVRLLAEELPGGRVVDAPIAVWGLAWRTALRRAGRHPAPDPFGGQLALVLADHREHPERHHVGVVVGVIDPIADDPEHALVPAKVAQVGEHAEPALGPGQLPEPDYVDLAGLDVGQQSGEVLPLLGGEPGGAAVGVPVDAGHRRAHLLDPGAAHGLLVVNGLLGAVPVLGHAAVQRRAQAVQLGDVPLGGDRSSPHVAAPMVAVCMVAIRITDGRRRYSSQ